MDERTEYELSESEQRFVAETDAAAMKALEPFNLMLTGAVNMIRHQQALQGIWVLSADKKKLVKQGSQDV